MTELDRNAPGPALLLALSTDPLAVMRALKARQWHAIAAAASLAELDADPKLALSDPVLYTDLRRSITEWHLHGYRAFDIGRLEHQASVDCSEATVTKRHLN